jgi:O-antigen ligase
MRQIFFIDDTTENKISYYHLAAFLVTLPFDRFYSQLALISFLVHTVIHVTKPKLRNIFTVQTLVLSSVILITIIGLLYSPDKSEGIQDMQKQLAIVLFPVLLACSALDLSKYRINLLLLFSFTCVFTTLYLYFDAVHIILFNKLPLSTLFTGVFINHNFSQPIALHATYFAMFCLLSAVVLFYVVLHEVNKKRRIAYFLSILILLAGLLQLASRAVLIAGIIIAICFPFLLLKTKGRLTFIADVAAILVLTGLLITNVSSFKMRYVVQFKNDLTQESINAEILEPRITRWLYILNEIKKSPVIGYGSGSEKRVLNQTYFDHKLYNSYLHELNSHNQYLAFLLETGIWGLFIFLLTLFTGLVLAFRQKNILFLCFLVIISVVSFSENVLDTNKGIFFYAFFFSLFVLSGKPFDRLFRFKRDRNRSH